jgi:hypothetical protein
MPVGGGRNLKIVIYYFYLYKFANLDYKKKMKSKYKFKVYLQICRVGSRKRGFQPVGRLIIIYSNGFLPQCGGMGMTKF